MIPHNPLSKTVKTIAEKIFFRINNNDKKHFQKFTTLNKLFTRNDLKVVIVAWTI